MLSLKKLIQLFLGSFCALNGILDFYVDIGSERVRWAYSLAIYRIVHNFVVFCLTTKFLLDFWEDHEADIEKSLLMTLNYLTYFLLVFIAIVSSMFCCYRCKNRIFMVIQKLKHQKKLSRQMGYEVPKGNQLFVDSLMFLLTFLLLLRITIHVTTFVFSGKLGLNHPCNCFFPECMIFAMNYIIFAILVEISQCWWRLESSLKMIMRNPKRTSINNQLYQIQRIHRMLQGLIDLTTEVCSIFKFALLSYMIRLLWSGIVAGYLVVRFILGNGHSDIEFTYLVLAFIICIQPLMLSLVVSNIAHTAGFLIESVKDILRTPHKQGAQVERSIEWFMLQLAWQHTYISIFGTFRINRSLAFQCTSVILLQVVYMVQSDYILMTKKI
ncbi:LOW QUALITY PROTEIN: putative gustatory receptor 85a [Drosophila eugracilis]|uniref:LOW QUALITY PROTEIN: putative gustatory receptor 85a n=1 Tax=Drosophila eugracilis TaxID=29029 RepID=UPI001BDAFDC8|nr:LOW QUALITY PROTEIN: putative gustatory receptor 85a [Drosophila eugracilis]